MTTHYTRNPVELPDGTASTDETHYLRELVSDPLRGVGARPFDGPPGTGYVFIGDEASFEAIFTAVDEDSHATAPSAVVVPSPDGTLWQISVTNDGDLIPLPQ